MQRATSAAPIVNTYLAAGFGSLTRTTGVPQVKNAMTYDDAAHVWRAVFVRTLDELGPLTPMAFAVWDGGRTERGGYKQLSAWHYVRLPGKTADAAYVKELSFGYNPGDLGDATKGKATAETVCIACHQLPGKRFAPAGFAPDLSDIGAIATASYIRDSVMTPSLVLVPTLQPNNHYAKNSNPDQFRAYGKSDIYEWATKDEKGQVVSKMPQFSNLGPEQVADLVAFLKTLDGHVKETP
jgi:complex iron-sulfur molybdoenzyme family reductase subunit gamma